ncbi:MAG: thiamine phosphate synthase [Pseudomonadota bacterium]
MPGLDVFYPIVPDLAWLERVAGLGARTIQLRMKDVSDAEIASTVKASLATCAAAGCQLIVNDYWRIAIDCGADFIHLGQEDLASADRAAIKASGARLGVSTHSLEELDVALAASPDYVALGPIYETKLKKMKWQPQGLDRLGEWRTAIGDLPLVGIAGITVERADGVINAGADSVAVITDFLTHPDPDARLREWLAWAETRREAR